MYVCIPTGRILHYVCVFFGISYVVAHLQKQTKCSNTALYIQMVLERNEADIQSILCHSTRV